MNYYEKDMLVAFNDLRLIIREEFERQDARIEELLSHYKAPTKSLNVKQLAARFDVSTKTVYNWIRKGIISGFMEGGKRKFSIKEVDEKLVDPRYWGVLEKKGLKKPNNLF